MAAIRAAVLGLDRWLDSIRIDWPTPGYGGPVVHWWNHQLAYRGTGLDWRYEGIVGGYLDLWRRDGARHWLDKAARAGDDLIGGQLPNGHFRNSRFEQNPGEGGTPHEAAVDVALLSLADALIDRDPDRSGQYRGAAERNLEAFLIGQLWHAPTATLRDGIDTDSFVPNKAATFIEVVLLLSDLNGDPDLIERYAIPTAEKIVDMQVRYPGDPLHGAIAQNRFGGEVVHAFFPLYVARCLPPLLDLATRTGDDGLRDAALAGARFLERCRNRDGSYPQALYPNGRRVDQPRWVAGAGDILRALLVANQYGAEIPNDRTVEWILSGARTDGRIVTAQGFGRVLPFLLRRDRALDEIGVAGWCDKAFRALSLLVEPTGERPAADTGTRDRLEMRA
jgi:hypothetical protein